MVWCSVQSPIHCQDRGGLPSFWVGRVQDQALKRVKQEQTPPCQQLLMDQNEVLGKLCKYVAFVLFLNASPASFLHVVFPQLLTFHLVKCPKLGVLRLHAIFLAGGEKSNRNPQEEKKTPLTARVGG